MTVAQMIREKLDDLGADGLLECEGGSFISKKDLENDALDEFVSFSEFSMMAPAFRHADGMYHTVPQDCFTCCEGIKEIAERCFREGRCSTLDRRLSHKEATK